MQTVLISGAGIIGLSIALELATLGVEVTVFERGTAMRESSWAAAGMLAANDPENAPQLAPLSRLSLSLYPDFLRRVEHLSGVSVPLRSAATLQVCRPEHAPRGAAVLSRQEALRRVPGLHPHLEGDFLWLEESSLDPRDLCTALPAAARMAGVRLIENCPVIAMDVEHKSVTAKTLDGEGFKAYHADRIIVCNGAWTGHGVRSGERARGDNEGLPRCEPRKGQMLAVRMPPEHGVPILQTVLRSADVYLVPRSATADRDHPGSGLIIIGATVEDCGFDRGIRPEATAWLMEKAFALWPPIRSAQIEEVWTGIRPGTVDGLPLLGPLAPLGADESARIWVAAGHYRNGILLAPGTARAIASAMLGEPAGDPPIDLQPFHPWRALAEPAQR